MAEEPDLKCDIGPILKTFGGEQWHVYSCTEDWQLMLVSAPGTKAEKTIFVFQTIGEWLVFDYAKDTRPTEAARRELRALSDEQLTDLIEETRRVPRPR